MWMRPQTHNFSLAGTIHCVFEGYFVFNHQRMPLMQDFFGQLWKEYAKSDSRYMTFDPLVLSVESITIVCCTCYPGCSLSVFHLLTDH